MHRLLSLFFLPLIIAAVAVAVGVAIVSPRQVEKLGNSHLVERDGVLYEDQKTFTGLVIERFPDGAIYTETNYVRGLKEGRSREFATTGARRAIWHYRNGRKDGLQEGWFTEGPKSFEENFKDGLLDGLQTQWHLNGTIFTQQNYIDGVETSKKILYSSSEVYTNYVKQDGHIYGLNGGELCSFQAKREGEL